MLGVEDEKLGSLMRYGRPSGAVAEGTGRCVWCFGVGVNIGS